MAPPAAAKNAATDPYSPNRHSKGPQYRSEEKPGRSLWFGDWPGALGDTVYAETSFRLDASPPRKNQFRQLAFFFHYLPRPLRSRAGHRSLELSASTLLTAGSSGAGCR